MVISPMEKCVMGKVIEQAEEKASYFMWAGLQRSHCGRMLSRSQKKKRNELCGFGKEKHSRY